MQPIISQEESSSQNPGSFVDVTNSSRPILDPAKSSTFEPNEAQLGATPNRNTYTHVTHPLLVNPPVFYQPPIPSNFYPSQPPAYYYPPPSYPFPPPYQTPYSTDSPYSLYSAPPPYYSPPQNATLLPPAESERQPFCPVLEKNSWALASAAAAVGSIVGLSAAAATRWWNGDDWYLVARDRTLPTMTEAQNASEKAPAIIDRPPLVESIGESHAHPNSAKIYGQGEYLYTNRAMELLRQQQLSSETTYNQEILSQLRDVQESLVSIQSAFSKDAYHAIESDGGVDDSEDHLNSRMDTILGKLESILGIDNGDDTTNERTEPLCTPEGELDNEVQPCVTSNEETSNSFSKPTLLAADAIDSEGMVFNLRKALAQLVLGKDDPTISHTEFISGVQLLYLYASNISNHPHVPRYRRIYCENQSYQQSIEKLSGASALLVAVGFHLGQNSKIWEWMPVAVANSDDDDRDMVENMYLERAREAVSALKVLKAASNSVGTEELLKSAMQAAGLHDNSESDSNSKAIEALSVNERSLNSSEILLDDADAFVSQSVETPFVCDTDIVTTEAATLLAASSADTDFLRKNERDEIVSDESKCKSESEVWK